jgi:hypothetical protein
LEDDTVWLSQRQLADLYQVGVNTINYHIKQIYLDGELEQEATIRNYRIVQSEAKREVTRSVEFYNLEVILAVGYRVRSPRGVEFRQWATQRLNFQASAERIARLDSISAYTKLAESKKKDSVERLREIEAGKALQEKIKYALNSMDGSIIFKNRNQVQKHSAWLYYSTAWLWLLRNSKAFLMQSRSGMKLPKSAPTPRVEEKLILNFGIPRMCP